MKLRELTLKNWMNFKRLDGVRFVESSFVIGANASGKSNLLDALRFLRDVALPAGKAPGAGGLQEAVSKRGGLSRLRCLNAQTDTEVRLEATVEDEDDSVWVYGLGFRGEGKGNNRIVLTHERVLRDGALVGTSRPDAEDRKDPDLLTQTDLETPHRNRGFRSLAHFFGSITYLHLVPQLLKHADEIGGRTLHRDPFGQGFLLRIAETPERIRNSRLRRIGKALGAVVPQFREIRFLRDSATGHPHLEANFVHWREHGAWQREHQFSDGTLRLVGLLWSLLEGDSLLLLEEPELSLNNEIIRQLPRLLRAVLRGASRQVIVTTHSETLLSDEAIGSESVIRLRPTANGTEVLPPSPEEEIMLKSGFSVGVALLPGVRPKNAERVIAHLAA